MRAILFNGVDGVFMEADETARGRDFLMGEGYGYIIDSIGCPIAKTQPLSLKLCPPGTRAKLLKNGKN
jgi:hypothetical protein